MSTCSKFLWRNSSKFLHPCETWIGKRYLNWCRMYIYTHTYINVYRHFYFILKDGQGILYRKVFEFQIMKISGFWKLTTSNELKCNKRTAKFLKIINVYVTPQVWRTKIPQQILISLFVTRIHKSLEVIARIDRMLTADAGQGHGPARWGGHTYLTLSILLQS